MRPNGAVPLLRRLLRTARHASSGSPSSRGFVGQPGPQLDSPQLHHHICPDQGIRRESGVTKTPGPPNATPQINHTFPALRSAVFCALTAGTASGSTTTQDEDEDEDDR